MTKQELGFKKFTVKPTSVIKQPSTDFIAMMRDDDMEELNVKENDYIMIRNIVISDIFNWDKIEDELENKSLIRFLNSLFANKLEHKDPNIVKNDKTIKITGTDFSPIIITLNDDVEKFPILRNIKKLTGSVKFEMEGMESKIFPVREESGEKIVTEQKFLRTHAHLFSINNDLSEINEKKLGKGEIAIDQTYREALGLEKGETVDIKKTDDRFGVKESVLRRLNYQRAVVRVQQNAPFMENKTPVVCVCEEMVESIGAKYGDNIRIEAKGNKITAKCAKLSSYMTEFHDSVVGRKLSQDEMVKLNAKYEGTWIKNSFNLLTKWGRVSESHGELIHPIFMDQISRKSLDVKPLEPVKIRKSLSWETQKKINSFGGFGMLALAILVPEIVYLHSLGVGIEGFVIAIAITVGFIIWSVLTSSKFNTSIAE